MRRGQNSEYLKDSTSRNLFLMNAYFTNFLMTLQQRDASSKLATIENTWVRRPAQGRVGNRSLDNFSIPSSIE